MPLDQQAVHTKTFWELKSNYDDDGYQSISEKPIKRLILWMISPKQQQYVFSSSYDSYDSVTKTSITFHYTTNVHLQLAS